MKNNKDFIVEKEDMDNKEEFLTEKKQKKTGIRKYCIFAGALVLFGTVTGISLNKNHKIKDDISIESTGSINSLNNLDSTRIVNSQDEQIPIVLRISEMTTIYEETSAGIVARQKEVVMTQNETLIPKLDKEIIAIQPINPQIIDTSEGYQISFTDLLLICDGEKIPNSDFVFTKSVVNLNGVQVYSNATIIGLLKNNAEASIENEQLVKTI